MLFSVKEFKEALFNINESNFVSHALALFQYQAKNNSIYREYLKLLGVTAEKVRSLNEIPFLPIDFFKTHNVVTGDPAVKIIFESSGTTGLNTSRHLVADPEFYLSVSEKIFQLQFGNVANYNIVALLPSYLERTNSSLVYMVKYFTSLCSGEATGFFLNEFEIVNRIIEESAILKNKLVVFGVTFALLDLCASSKGSDKEFYIIETGGMKGRRKEMIREEVHYQFKTKFPKAVICSEYGMTELLSQAYALNGSIFTSPPWMKVMFRNINDPFHIDNSIKRGGINVIDLANIDSCAFIETKDLGENMGEGRFKVLGRFDNADIRGCNLLVV